MGAARIVILLVALVAAIGLAVVVRNMMAGNKPPAPVAVAAAPPPIPMVRVLVAQRDIAIGARLAPEDMGWQAFPAQGINASFITDGGAAVTPPDTLKEKAAAGAQKVMENVSGAQAGESLVGAIVREAMLAGEPIQLRKIVRGGEGGYLAVVLAPGKRAMGVPVTAETAVGGLILPGDRVDVIQSYEVPSPDGNSSIRLTHPVVVNVRVLAIDQKTSPDAGANALVGAVATLEVAPDAAAALTEAIARGPMQLALRSYADVGAPSGRASVPQTASVGGPSIKIFSQGETSEVRVSQ